nr:hypothetical protein [Piscirickettsia salmonis]
MCKIHTEATLTSRFRQWYQSLSTARPTKHLVMLISKRSITLY